MKIACLISYKGSAYHGFQRQSSSDLPTVQGLLEQSLSMIANHPVKLYCAGRTDAGVHAIGQVIHFESSAKRELSEWTTGGNAKLPCDIRILKSVAVVDDFHARFSAQSRRYCYRIFNQRINSALDFEQMTHIPYQLDAEKMHEAAQHLVGLHDFSAYRATGCQSHTAQRCVEEIAVKREGNVITLEIEANAFLHHMVRNIVGVLIDIGQGVQPLDWAKTVLESRDRKQAGVTAPPHGLCFEAVRYERSLFTPTQS